MLGKANVATNSTSGIRIENDIRKATAVPTSSFMAPNTSPVPSVINVATPEFPISYSKESPVLRIEGGLYEVSFISFH